MCPWVYVSSTDGHRHQFRRQQEHPLWGMVRKDTSCKLLGKWHCPEAAPGARPLISSVGLLCGTGPGHVSSGWETHSSLPREVHSLSQRGAGLWYRQVPASSHRLVSRAALIGPNCAALVGWGKPQSYWLKLESRTSSIKAGWMAETMQAGRLSKGLLHEVQFAWEACVQKWLPEMEKRK